MKSRGAMAKPTDQINYRGWRVGVSTPLGFFALVLLVTVPTLASLAVAADALRGLLIVALIGIPLGLVAVVAFLAVYHPGALDGTKATKRTRRPTKVPRRTAQPAAVKQTERKRQD